jgi:hypothetical protein
MVELFAQDETIREIVVDVEKPQVREFDVRHGFGRRGMIVEIDAALGGELDGAEVSVGAIGKIGGIGKA